MSQSIEQFGKFLLLEKLAAGGMAEVYLSKTLGAEGVNKFVAIKRILPQYSGNQEFIDMFKEEAKIAVNLNHGNVVSIFDFGMEKSSFFLVMEYVAGKNLRQIINELKKVNKAFTIEQIVFIIKEVAAGLDHAHRCVDSNTGRPLNITHRDMSPQNIMVSYEGEVKVIDFGIAKAETQAESTKAGTLKGKFGYMSPEQAEGFPIDPRTDIFALGIVLWELLANDRLFTSSNEAAILRKIRECQIPSIRKINPSVPPELERIINKALAKDKNLRYQTAANFHRDLNRFLNTQYPDFSPHDFSVFVKDSFHQNFIDQRNKLVEYSKMQFVEDKTTVTATITQPNAYQPKANIPEDEFADRKLDIDTNTNHEVNLKDLMESSKTQLKKIQVQKSLNTNNSGLSGKTVTSATIPNPRQPLKPTIPGVPQAPKANSALDGITQIITKSVIGLALIFGGYWTYVNYVSEMINPKQTAAVKANRTIAKKEQRNDLAQAAGVTVAIYSQPAGADIYIDNKKTGYKTPATVSVPQNKAFTLGLRKACHEAYSTETAIANPGQTVNIPLKSDVACVSLVVANMTGGEEIFINGTKIKETLPLKDYAIPANTAVKIRITNPNTGLSDEHEVNLKVKDQKLLEFILGRKP